MASSVRWRQRVGPAFRLHMVEVPFGGAHGTQVWLNTEAADFDGLVIGAGNGDRAALEDALAALETAAAEISLRLKGEAPDA